MRRGIILAFITSILSGCTTHSIVKSSSSSDDFSCKLVNAHAKAVNSNPNSLREMLGTYTRSIGLGIKKLDSKNLKIWLKLNRLSSKEDPLKNPGIILRSYKKDNMLPEYKTKGILYSGASVIVPNESDKVKDIWPKSERYDLRILSQVLDEKALEFVIPTEQFNKIIESDVTKILIETHYEPFIAFIEKEDLVPLKEFNRECLSNPNNG